MSNVARLKEALTSKKWQFEFIEQSSCPKDIYSFFQIFLPHLELQTFDSRLILGGFYINGLNVNKNIELKVPCKIEYYEPKFDINKINNIFPEFSNDWIVYEDEYLLGVFKPNRLPSLPTKEQNIYNLKNYIEKYCACNIHMPSRLDTSTQGLVIISKNIKFHNYLQKAFERKLVTKRYLLASSKETSWNVKTLSAYISKSRDHAILREISSYKGKDSITIFTKIKANRNLNYFFARPLTGRTHQIRLHASHIDIPILGDNFYGGEKADCLHLLSYQVGLWQPFLNKYLEISVPAQLIPNWADPALKKAAY